MNEHEEYLRERMTRDPKAVRWVCIGLVAFWVGVILVARGCA